MSKAENRALELYPIESGEVFDANGDIYESDDKNYAERFAYIKGYQQAEKDLELTVDDIMKIDALLIEMWNNQSENKYQEVLKRFKERKENGE